VVFLLPVFVDMNTIVMGNLLSSVPTAVIMLLTLKNCGGRTSGT